MNGFVNSIRQAGNHVVIYLYNMDEMLGSKVYGYEPKYCSAEQENRYIDQDTLPYVEHPDRYYAGKVAGDVGLMFFCAYAGSQISSGANGQPSGSPQGNVEYVINGDGTVSMVNGGSQGAAGSYAGLFGEVVGGSANGSQFAQDFNNLIGSSNENSNSLDDGLGRI